MSGVASPHSGREKSSGAAVAGLHLVHGEQDSVPIGDLAQSGQEPVGRHDVATLAEHGLDHEGSDVVG